MRSVTQVLGLTCLQPDAKSYLLAVPERPRSMKRRRLAIFGGHKFKITYHYSSKLGGMPVPLDSWSEWTSAPLS